ncbi:MAG TPA: class I SAM-dependent methyltransferase [Candidatus Andersenbacteria bacterium]|nr:class I SAM-dependent methyltransferase [Candidatus Andersenbacteria bacterium]
MNARQQPNYSQIISPEDYNQIIGQHLFIRDADLVIKRLVDWHGNEHRLSRPIEVVEFGCGPARILPLLSQIENINLTGIDHDRLFVEYAERTIQQKHLNAKVILGDATSYVHPKPINIVVSQGFHHHIPKGEATQQYLQNVHHQLYRYGVYIVGDEFLPHYIDAEERLVRAVIWYFLIIWDALMRNMDKLAIEEAKTLLDDLAEGTQSHVIKTEAQIELVFESVTKMYDPVHPKKQWQMNQLARNFLKKLPSLQTTTVPNDTSMDLSRGDFKICHRVFQDEVTQAGFTIIGVTNIGPIETFGGLVVYVLQKI